MNNQRLSLHSMIGSVIAGAKEKIASDEAHRDEKVKKLISYEKAEHGHIPTVDEEEAEKTASLDFTDPTYIDKLASAVDYIAAHVGDIEPEGVVSRALHKMAAEGSPQGAGKGPGSLELNKPTAGKQSYKKDKPKTDDASESEAGTALSDGENGTGKTQIENNMHAAPGQTSGISPTAKYPAKGPLVNSGKNKTAGYLGDAAKQVKGGYSELSNARKALKGATDPDKISVLKDLRNKGLTDVAKGVGKIGGPALAAGVVGYGGYRALSKDGKEKTASEVAMEHILMKLAGEDVSPASISAARIANPLAGMGQLASFDSSQSPPKASGGPTTGFGNQGRSHIASSAAAIAMTKKDAKGPQKIQLKEVLEEPALNKATDKKVHENLRNADKGGVKIAALRQKLKVAMEGMTQMAGAGDPAADPAGAQMGAPQGAPQGAAPMAAPAENERVRKLKLLLAQAQGETANQGAMPPPAAAPQMSGAM